MKLKQISIGMAGLVFATITHAQSAGSFVFETGWLHFAPRDRSDPLRITNIGGQPVSIIQPGSGASISNSDTVSFSAAYFLTDNISTEFVMGVPPTFDISGTGTLEQFGKIGSARQWSPALLFRYHFFGTQSRFRPYAGIGVSRVWFSDEKITNPAFNQAVLLSPSSTVSTTSSWAPVFNVGFSYQFSDRWFGGFSVSYLPLRTTATIRSANLTSQADIRIDPIITSLNIGYRF